MKKMTDNMPDASPVAPGLVQLDEKTLVSVRLARSGQAPGQFRAVAIAALESRHRVPLSSSLTAGYGPDPKTAVEACLNRVRTTLSKKKSRSRRADLRPGATL